MNDRRAVPVLASCDCADCRQYRLWRAEGTDEWQPDGASWHDRSAAADAYAVDVDGVIDAETAGPLSSH